MRITKSEIVILVDLYKSHEGLSPFTFYQRHRFSAALVYKAVERFEKLKYLQLIDDKLAITQEGREFVDSNKFVFDSNKFERIPEHYLGPKLDLNSPYIPNTEIMSEEIINLKNIEGDD